MAVPSSAPPHHEHGLGAPTADVAHRHSDKRWLADAGNGEGQQQEHRDRPDDRGGHDATPAPTRSRSPAPSGSPS